MSYYSKIIVALLLCALSSSLAAQDSIVIASSNNFPPINLLDRNSELIGFGRDLSSAVFESLNIKTEHAHSPYWPEVLDWLENGKAQVIHDAAFSEARKSYLDFSIPILEMNEVIFVLSENRDINTLNSIRSKKVACIDKHITHLYLQQLNISCNVYKTPIDGVYALLSGHVDAFIYPEEIVQYYLQKFGKSRAIKIVGAPLRRLKWSMVVKKGNAELLQRINQGIEIVKQNGRYEQIHNKWFGKELYFGYTNSEIQLMIITSVIFSLLAGIVWGLIWRNKTLQVKNRTLEETFSQLKLLQNQRDQFFRLSADLLCIADFKGYFTDLNASWETVLGYSQEELKAKPFIEFVHPDDQENTIKAASALGERPNSIVGFINRYRQRSGGYRWFQWNAVSEVGCKKIYAVAHDITDLKDRDEKLEQQVSERTQALAEQEKRLSHLLSSSPAVIYTCAPQGDFGATFISPNVKELFGMEAEKFIQDPKFWSENIHPDDVEKVFEDLPLLFEHGSHSHSYRFRRNDGEYRWVYDELKLTTDENGNPVEVIGYWIDITELKTTEQALIKSRDLAERANLAKSEFLSSMSHELRTPLNAILGFSQLLKMDIEDSHHNENIQEIITAGQLLLELINDILDLSTIESSNLHLQMETCNLESIINESITLVQHLAAKKRVTLPPVTLTSSKHYIHADKTRLKQVLLNLLSNAIKYNHENGLVGIQVDILQTQVKVTVTDTGPGIQPEQRQRLFQAFDRAGAENSNIEGTGIGLVITKRLVEMMGGDMGYETELGKGSQFWIQFDLCPAPSLASAIDEAEAQENNLPANILYVEDNPASLRLVQQIMQHHSQFKLLSALSGEQALEMAYEEKPDIILLDINLPGISGYEVLEKLRSHKSTKDTAIIALTSKASKEEISRGLHKGFDAYLTKPLQVKQLLGQIETFMEEKSA